MNEETSQSQVNKPVFGKMGEWVSYKTPVDKPKNKLGFWAGFALGLPIYPLVIPWILLLLPERFAEVYFAYYAVYVRMIMGIIGG